MAVLLSAAFVPAALAAPPNDAFADAAELTGFPVEVQASNEGASAELGEPRYFGERWSGQDPPEAEPYSVWWRWTAPETGPVAVELCSTAGPSGGLGSAVAVWEGDELSSLRYVGSNSGLYPPDCPKDHDRDRVAFFAFAGRRYAVQMESLGPGSRFRLDLSRAGWVARSTVRVRSERRTRVVYKAAPGEVNQASFSLAWEQGEEFVDDRPHPWHPPFAFSIGSYVAVAAGPGCLSTGRSNVIRCPIPTDLRRAGPLVELGDRDDSVSLDFSRPATVVFGGTGNDQITAGGRLHGGPGDDEITARTWGKAEIDGGPGNDTITGSNRGNVINPGPGADVVDARLGLDVLHTRDGEVDHVDCSGFGIAYIDGLDEALCGRVRRRGAARAIPSYPPAISVERSGVGDVSVSCPRDAPRVCAGTVTVSRRDRIFLQLPFRIRRPEREYGESSRADFKVRPRKLRAMEGKVRITVRSRDRASKLRTASRIDELEIS